MRNTELKEAQAGIKIAGRNINNLRYEKVDLKLNIQETNVMACGPITSWKIDGETLETVADFISLGSKITADGNCSHEIKRCLLFWSYDQPR